MVDVRPYHSPRRERSAAATRRDIVDAARRLFSASGYAQVTVGDIAREAGTAVKTVYSSAGGKADLLLEIVREAAAHSGAQSTVAEVRRTTDLTGALAALARGTRAGNEHHQEAIGILYGAMPVHESAEALWEEGTALYRAALLTVAEHLDTLETLPSGMGIERCADVLWFCFGFSAWRTLVGDCHWTWDQAQAWLTANAAAMLGPG